jgi:hypothetical protein
MSPGFDLTKNIGKVKLGSLRYPKNRALLKPNTIGSEMDRPWKFNNPDIVPLSQ